MRQRELNRAVAQATGEEIREIRRRGFGMADPAEVDFDPEANPFSSRIVDWDRLDADRPSLFPTRHGRGVLG